MSHRIRTSAAGDPLSMQGPIVIDDEPGFIAAIWRNPVLWGAAIALAVSGVLGMVTL